MFTASPRHPHHPAAAPRLRELFPTQHCWSVMSLSSLVRRSVALTSATALLGGALGAGALPALAAPGEPATITSFSPVMWDNRSTMPLTVTGTGFFAAGDPATELNDRVVFTPVTPDAANEVAAFSVQATQSTSTTSLSVNVPLAMAPAVPGKYRVTVEHANGTPSNVAPTLFEVYGFGPANATGVAFGSDASSSYKRAVAGTSPLNITGSNIAIGAKVEFVKADGNADTGLTFFQHNPAVTENAIDTQGADGRSGTGYASTSLLHGNYGYRMDGATPLFTPGLHQLRVVNSDGDRTGTTVSFSQPYFTTGDGNVTPTSIGVGAGNVVVTVKGQGIKLGSKLSVQDKGTSSCDDVSMGASTVSGPDGQGTYTTISAPVSVAACATETGSRSITISGPDGAYYTAENAISVAGAPTFDQVAAPNDVLGQGAKRGYGSDGVWTSGEGITITGTNFVGDAGNDPAKMTKFDFGPGVTVTTRHVVSSSSAEVTIDVANDAVVGDRAVKVTNPNGGSTTKAVPVTAPVDPAPFAVEAGPQVTKVAPASFQPSQAGTSVTLTGSFSNGTSYGIAISNDSGMTYPTSATASSATTLSFSVGTNGAGPGLRDVTVTDSTNFGRFVCAGCLGVDSLQVTKVDGTSGSSASNSASDTTTVTFASTNPSGLEGVTAASTVRLNRLVSLPGQPAILGTGLTGAGAGLATAAFDLRAAAPGQYSATIVLDPSAPTPTTWNCTGCLTVTGAAITTASVTPAGGGQGATNRELTIVGTNFARGMGVSIDGDGVAVHHPVYVDDKTFKVQVDIASDAPAGARVVTVTNGDGGTGSTGSKTTNLRFEVTPAPVPTAVSPSAAGQGAGFAPGQTLSVTVTGDDFSGTAVPVFGEGIEVVQVTGRTQGSAGTPPLSQPTQDTLTATIRIAQGADVGVRAVVVDNGDGGAGSKAEAFTVNPGPVVSTVVDPQGQPVLRPDGVKRTIRFLGSGFATADPKTALAVTLPDGSADSGITLENVAVVSAAEITADVTVAAGAALGARTVAVTNASDKGYGTCETCVVVANLPGDVLPLALAAGPSSLTATWDSASANGSPVVAYRLTATRAGTTTPIAVDVPPGESTGTHTYTFSGLVNGATYTVTAAAVNAAGFGPVATAKGIPGLLATLTAKASVKTVTYGAQLVYSGRLTRTGTTTGIPSRAVRLTFVPAIGKAFSQTVATSSTGTWAFAYSPRVPSSSSSRTSQYTVKVYPAFLGDSTYRKAVASTLTTFVAPRVKVSSPLTGSSSRASTTLKVTGSVLPSKAGKVVYLYRFTRTGRTLLAKTTLSSSSTYAFSIKPGRGTYTLRVYIPATPGNVAAYSTAVVVKRT